MMYRSPANMTNAQTAAHLREYVKTYHDPFSWPTDACGYEQHMRFVHHRNANWRTGNMQDWRKFVLAYADSLEKIR